MALPIITECCYTCQSCLVVKQICQLKNCEIMNIYRDKCDKYCQRKMELCALCGTYVIELAQHVKHQHKKTMQEYRILSKNSDVQNKTIRRKNLWERTKRS